MALTIGTQVGSHVITALLGKDGIGAGGTAAASAGMVVVLNWLEELKARTGS
jgi:hypothetical protein